MQESRGTREFLREAPVGSSRRRLAPCFPRAIRVLAARRISIASDVAGHRPHQWLAEEAGPAWRLLKQGSCSRPMYVNNTGITEASILGDAGRHAAAGHHERQPRSLPRTTSSSDIPAACSDGLPVECPGSRVRSGHADLADHASKVAFPAITNTVSIDGYTEAHAGVAVSTIRTPSRETRDWRSDLHPVESRTQSMPLQGQ